MPLHSVAVPNNSTREGVSVSHDSDTGVMIINFERFETSDAVLPQYQVCLTTEHFAAWVGHVLRERWGRRSKEMTGQHSGPRFAMALRLTEADSNLVYYTHNAEGVIVLRRGRVVNVPFRVVEGMGQFEGRLGELAREDRRDVSVAAEFVEYVVALVG